MTGRHSAALDGVRGLALLGVVFFHSGALPFGWLGVPVFFVLSGHFITRILFEHGTPLRAFVRNRLLRLAPLYWTACVALTALAISGFGPAQLRGDLPYLWTWTYDLRPLTPGWVDNNLYDHLWSLGVEVQLYALWASFAVIVSRRWLVRIVIALAVAGPVLRIAVWGLLSAAGYPHADLADITYCLPSTYVDAFAIGACTALPEIRDRLGSVRQLVGVCCGALGLVVLGQVGLGLLRHGRFQADLGFPIALPYQAGWVWGYSLVALAAGSMVLAAGRAFAWTPLARLGLISYGIYLVHRPIGQLCERLSPTNPLAAGILVLCVSVPLAALSYRRFELPFIQRKHASVSRQSLPSCNGAAEATDVQVRSPRRRNRTVKQRGVGSGGRGGWNRLPALWFRAAAQRARSGRESALRTFSHRDATRRTGTDLPAAPAVVPGLPVGADSAADQPGRNLH